MPARTQNYPPGTFSPNLATAIDKSFAESARSGLNPTLIHYILMNLFGPPTAPTMNPMGDISTPNYDPAGMAVPPGNEGLAGLLQVLALFGNSLLQDPEWSQRGREQRRR